MKKPRAKPRDVKHANLSVRVTPLEKQWLREHAARLTQETGYPITLSAVATRLVREAMERMRA